MSESRSERANLLSPILAATAILGSGIAFVYVALASLAQLG